MKKLLLIYGVLCQLISNAQTNIYHPFPDSSAQWNFHYVMFCPGIDERFFSYALAGDTTIGVKTYQKLELVTVNQPQTNCLFPPAIWNGCVRQDTAMKKVFVLVYSDSTEQLLYDFNMGVGDTVKGLTQIYNANYPDIVQSIDSVLVGNSYRKRWLINPWYFIYFIEGIGSTYGLNVRSPGNTTDHADYSLICFKQDGQTLYPDTLNQCDIIDAVNNLKEKNTYVNISPNPFILSTLLQVSSEFECAELKIYNALGILVRNERTFNQNRFVLNRNELQRGVYLLHLINDKGQMASARLVVD